MASGAGGNRVGSLGGLPILRLRPTATPFTGWATGYGTIGLNDSGLVLIEGEAFTKWRIQLAPEGPLTSGLTGGVASGALPSGYEVSIFFTIDRSAYMALGSTTYPTAQNQSYPGPNGGPMGSQIVPPGSWVLADEPSAQGGSSGNPLTSSTPFFSIGNTVVALRAVLTGVTPTPAAGAIVYAMGVP